MPAAGVDMAQATGQDLRYSAVMTHDLLIARAVHVLSIVVWFGGVAFVTLVVLPLARGQQKAAQKLALFEAMEDRFGTIARWAVALAGLRGLWMLLNNNMWRSAERR